MPCKEEGDHRGDTKSWSRDSGASHCTETDITSTLSLKASVLGFCKSHELGRVSKNLNQNENASVDIKKVKDLTSDSFVKRTVTKPGCSAEKADEAAEEAFAKTIVDKAVGESIPSGTLSVMQAFLKGDWKECDMRAKAALVAYAMKAFCLFMLSYTVYVKELRPNDLAIFFFFIASGLNSLSRHHQMLDIPWQCVGVLDHFAASFHTAGVENCTTVEETRTEKPSPLLLFFVGLVTVRVVHWKCRRWTLPNPLEMNWCCVQIWSKWETWINWPGVLSRWHAWLA